MATNTAGVTIFNYWGTSSAPHLLFVSPVLQLADWQRRWHPVIIRTVAVISGPQWSSMRLCGHIARIRCNATIYALNCKPGMAFLFTCLSVRRFCKINIQHYILSMWNFTLILSLARKVSMCYKAWKQDYVPQTNEKADGIILPFWAPKDLCFQLHRTEDFYWMDHTSLTACYLRIKYFWKALFLAEKDTSNNYNQHSHRQTNLQNC